MLVLTWVYKYLFKTLLSVLLDIYLDIKFQDCIIILFLIFGGITVLFPQQLYLFTFLKQCARVPVFPYLLQCLLFSVFFESSHLNGHEIFIFHSMTLTYLYLLNVILGPIPAILFYVFNFLCLFPDSLHPFPIFCWVDWGFFSSAILFYFISLKTWKLQILFLLCLWFGTLEFGDTFLLRYNINM